jgi:hypothetical protein
VEELEHFEEESRSEEELGSGEELWWFEAESESEEELGNLGPKKFDLKKELELELQSELLPTVNLFVEVERVCVDLYQKMRAFLKDMNGEETQDEQVKELLDTSPPSRVRVKLITRTLQHSRTRRFHNFSSKIVALEELSDHLIAKSGRLIPQPSLLKAYRNNRSPEMNERETLEWMIQNGYLASNFLYCENPLDVLFGYGDHYNFDKERPPKRKGFSGVDFSFHQEYLKLMEVVSQFPREQDRIQDFVYYCAGLRWPLRN